MSKIVVMFNLKEGVNAEDYQKWALETDLPTVKALGSIENFEVLKSASLLGSDAQPPYAYIEILDVTDMDAFGADISTDTMQKVAAEFQSMADNPVFILTEKI